MIQWAGYEAGQRLLAMGGADSNDPNLRRLLAQLKNKGWLDKQQAENAEQKARYERYDWILGTLSSHISTFDKHGASDRVPRDGVRRALQI
jgi:hypothetical protein